MKDTVDMLLKNCKLIDGTGAAPVEKASVAVKDGKIYAIGGPELVGLYDASTELELSGRTLLPGFVNAHVHVWYGECDYLRDWVQTGITMIRDMGILDDVSAQEAVGKRVGLLAGPEYPRIIMTGKFITAPGGYGGSDPMDVSTPEDAERRVSELLDIGCDLIKTVLEDGYDPSTTGLPRLSSELLRAVCDAAHKRGVPVAAHVTQSHNLRILLEAGIDEASHNVYDPMPDELIATMVERNIAMVPTMNLYKSFCDRYGAGFWQCVTGNLRRFVRAGGRIAVGTDFMIEQLPWFESGMPHLEFKLLLEAGLTPMEIICAATKNGAEVCGVGDRLGTVEKGKLADLIVVNGNPLTDISALREVDIVIKDGILVKNRK